MQIIIVLSLLMSAFQPIAVQPPKRLLVLGNSLVLSPPDPLYDWWGYWGMAATDADHDFAHVLQGQLSGFYRAPVDLRARHVKPMETRPDKFNLKQYRDEIKWGADIVVIRMGDNVGSNEGIRQAYYAQMQELIEAVTKPGALLICTGRWYPEATVDAEQRAICEAHGGRWVVIADMYSESKYFAASEGNYSDEGVASHPGDVGHAEIAARIYQAIAQPPVFVPMAFGPLASPLSQP